MNLYFTNTIKNKTTHFAEKIINGLSLYYTYTQKNTAIYIDRLLKYRDIAQTKDVKIHTIREDKKNRWKVGTKIHFSEWSGRPYHSKRILFAPILKVTSIQHIEIKELFMTNSETSYQMPGGRIYTVEIDGRRLNEKEILKLAKNDGFNNPIELFNYLLRFSGKIIHWTELSY